MLMNILKHCKEFTAKMYLNKNLHRNIVLSINFRFDRIKLYSLICIIHLSVNFHVQLFS